MKNLGWKVVGACAWLSVIWNTPVHMGQVARAIEGIITMLALLTILEAMKTNTDGPRG